MKTLKTKVNVRAFADVLKDAISDAGKPNRNYASDIANLERYYYFIANTFKTWEAEIRKYTPEPMKIWLPVIGWFQIDWDHLLHASENACKQVIDIPMSPYMKNALVKLDGFTDDQKLTIDSPPSKAEKYIADKVRAELEKQYGPERTEYDHSLDCLAKEHYAVDCWRNFKPDMRQIVAGQAEERRKRFLEFTEPLHILNPLENPKLRPGIFRMLERMPRNIHCVEDIKEWTAPFQRRKTQTSFPFGYRDDVVINEDNDKYHQLERWYGKTYGELCILIASEFPKMLKDEPEKLIDLLISLSWYMGYARNQRKKGRALIAESRLQVLFGNQMTQPETDECRAREPMYLGYNSRDILGIGMLRQALFARQNDCCLENFDYHNFDGSIAFEWLVLAGAYWMLAAADGRSREIVFLRTMISLIGYLIDGPEWAIKLIYGRIFSGETETNKTENRINGTAVYAALIYFFYGWTDIVYRRSQYPVIDMGDDVLATYPNPVKIFNQAGDSVEQCFKLFHDSYKHFMKQECGFEVHPDKGEFGCFFLQNRIFEDQPGSFIMTYAWTRVILSIFMLEDGKGLGPAGWTIATWAKLANIQEYKPGLRFVRDLVMEFDNMKLMLDKPMEDIIDMLKKEDAEALAKNKRARTSLDIINDNDPGKEKVTYDNPGYLVRLQTTIRNA